MNNQFASEEIQKLIHKNILKFIMIFHKMVFIIYLMMLPTNNPTSLVTFGAYYESQLILKLIKRNKDLAFFCVSNVVQVTK